MVRLADALIALGLMSTVAAGGYLAAAFTGWQGGWLCCTGLAVMALVLLYTGAFLHGGVKRMWSH